MANRIYTVGHSTRDFDEVLAMLENNEITHLVDVRTSAIGVQGLLHPPRPGRRHCGLACPISTGRFS